MRPVCIEKCILVLKQQVVLEAKVVLLSRALNNGTSLFISSVCLSIHCTNIRSKFFCLFVFFYLFIMLFSTMFQFRVVPERTRRTTKAFSGTHNVTFQKLAELLLLIQRNKKAEELNTNVIRVDLWWRWTYLFYVYDKNSYWDGRN